MGAEQKMRCGRGEARLSGPFEGTAARDDEEQRETHTRAAYDAYAVSLQQHPRIRVPEFLLEFNGFELRVRDTCGANFVDEVAFVVSFAVADRKRVRAQNLTKITCNENHEKSTCTRCRR